MLAQGSLAVPTLHGLPYYDKPPLLYWFIAASYQLFGVQDWAARLVSSGAGFATVLLTYCWGRQTLSRRAAFAGAAILALSGRFVYLERLVTMNSLLCLWVVAALAAAHIALFQARLRWGWWLLSACACGLGFLTKGPVVLVLVGVPTLLIQILQRRPLRSCVLAWLVHLAAVLALAGPWFVLVAQVDPEFLHYFFWRHNVVRYVAPFDHGKPWWFYLPEIGLGMLPWSLLLPGLVSALGKRRGETTARPPGLAFLVLCAFWCLLFYSAAGSKRSGYILPAMPPLALALGAYAEWLWRRLAGQERQLRLARAGYALGCATFLALFLATVYALPGHARHFSMRGQVRPLAALARDTQLPVVCYPRGWDSVSFYLQRDAVRVYTAAERSRFVSDLLAQPKTLAFVKSQECLQELLADLKGALHFVPCGRQGVVHVGFFQRPN
jgi:4-amino-4-deoxy-L-arabinose transferase-like glycosyltransferase